MTNTVSQVDSSSPAKTSQKRRLVIIGVAVLVGIGLAVPAAIFGPQLLGFQESVEDAEAGNTANAPAAGAAQQPTELTEFRNDQAGVTLSYPSSWAQLKTNDPQILLLASDGPENSFLLRSVQLPNTVGEQDLGAAKQLTDQIIGANKTARMLVESQPVKMAGLPGFWYFYSFQDEASGQQGAHSHFFLFKGNTMLTLVFQTVPLEKFQQSAPNFDKITGSLRIVNQ